MRKDSSPLAWFIGGILLILYGSAFISMGIWHFWNDLTFASDGVPDIGVVDNKDISYGSRGRTYYHVTYHYSVGMLTYRGARGTVSPNYWNRINVGESIPIIYLPNRPENCRIGHPGNGQIHMYFTAVPMVMGGIGTIGGIVWVVIGFKRRRWVG